MSRDVSPTPSPQSQLPPQSGLPQDIKDILANSLANGASGGGATKVPGFPTNSADRKIFVNYSGGPHATNVFMTLKEFYDQFYSMTDAQVQALAQKLVKANLIPSANQDRATIWQAWSAVINEAGSMADAGNWVTPYQRLAAYMKNPLDANGAGGGQPLTPYTTTAKSVNFTDPNQAKQILYQSLQDRIGRAPSPAEAQAYMAALHAAESDNPTITKTTYTPNATGNAYDTSSSASGGLDAGSYTTSYAEGHNKVEHASYQASTTYMNALMQALGAPV